MHSSAAWFVLRANDDVPPASEDSSAHWCPVGGVGTSTEPLERDARYGRQWKRRRATGAAGAVPTGAPAIAGAPGVKPGAGGVDSARRAKADSIRLAEKSRADSAKRVAQALLRFPGDAARAFVGAAVDVRNYTVRKDDLLRMSPPVRGGG